MVTRRGNVSQRVRLRQREGNQRQRPVALWLVAQYYLEFDEKCCSVV